MDGITWHVDHARIEDCGAFQTEEGEPMAYAKVATFGGLFPLSVSPDDLTKIAPHKGKMVKMSGRMTYEVKKGTGKEAIKFYVGEIVPHK